jgi:hypothetical protein
VGMRSQHNQRPFMPEPHELIEQATRSLLPSVCQCCGLTRLSLHGVRGARLRVGRRADALDSAAKARRRGFRLRA